VANVTAVVFFVLSGLISWPESLVMLAGAAAGGYLGGRLISVLPPAAVRTAIIVIGTAVTAIYAWRMWA
jgi:hypothetical protein